MRRKKRTGEGFRRQLQAMRGSVEQSIERPGRLLRNTLFLPHSIYMYIYLICSQSSSFSCPPSWHLPLRGNLPRPFIYTPVISPRTWAGPGFTHGRAIAFSCRLPHSHVFALSLWVSRWVSLVCCCTYVHILYVYMYIYSDWALSGFTLGGQTLGAPFALSRARCETRATLYIYDQSGRRACVQRATGKFPVSCALR